MDRSLKGIFGKVADSFDSRPAYPEEIIDSIVELTGITKESRILEVGCGTGKATRMFARRGFDVLGIDISEKMLAKVPKGIKTMCMRFEDYGADLIDLVVSAQAWHWIDPFVGYEKVISLDAKLAVFWGVPDYDAPMLRDLRALYYNYCQEFHEPRAVAETEQRLKTFGFEYVKREFLWDVEYDKTRFRDMVGTMSWVIALGERSGFDEELDIILEREPETFFVPYRYSLLVGE